MLLDLIAHTHLQGGCSPSSATAGRGHHTPELSSSTAAADAGGAARSAPCVAGGSHHISWHAGVCVFECE